MGIKVQEKQRQRAPSKRSIATRERILDSAEQVFSDRGFDGASIRDIARLAGVQGALVNHHGGSKEALFTTVVARRAQELAELRIEGLKTLKQSGDVTLRGVLKCFIAPLLEKVFQSGPAWHAYGRLIAHVSADARWRPITDQYFDPTAGIFLDEISELLPDVPRRQISANFVFMVSAMLSICASQWRIDALSEDGPVEPLIEALLNFCEAGFAADL